MKFDIPDRPYFVPPLQEAQGGVDFLGLRQANLDLMAQCLPGFNNVTWHLRPFSVLSWIYWQFYRLAEAKGIETPTKRDLRVFREKVEVLFTWGHRLSNVSGVPGISASSPHEGRARVPLTFAEWGRDATSTSLMAAIQYGPAAKTTAGLGFLEPLERPFFRTSGQGIRLAEALDQALTKATNRRELDRLGSGQASAEDAEQLMAGWSIENPTPAERRAFRAAFYDPKRLSDDSDLGRRSQTIALILAVLHAAQRPLSVEDIRSGMAFAVTDAGEPLTLNEPQGLARDRWLVLQVRQAQRLALETLFSWIESEVILRRAATGEDLAHAAFDQLAGSADWQTRGDSVATIRARLRERISDIGACWEAALADPTLALFGVMVETQKALRADHAKALVLAMQALFLVGRITELLWEKQHLRTLLGHGAVERVSLLSWMRTLERCEGMGLVDFLRFVFENFGLSQHFAVATRRYDGRSQRLRITLEEDGLVALSGEPWEPTVTADRLATALSLMTECGLVAWSSDPEGYVARQSLG